MSYVLNPSDGGDEYSLKAGAKTGSSVPIQLDAAVGVDTEVKLTEGSNITLTQVGSDEISIAASGGGGSPGGSNGQVQYNDGGSFGGNAAFTFDDTAGAENVVIEGSSTADLVRITQTGSGDALVVEDETSPDSTKFKVTQNGDVTIGTSQEFLGKFRVSGVSGNRNITDPSGQANIITRMEGPSSAVELMNFNTESGNLLIYNPYVDGEYTFMRRDGVSNNIETAFVITTEDTIKLGLGGKNYGTAGQVLTSGGPSAAASWTTVSGGGGSDPATLGMGYLEGKFFAANSGVVGNYALGVGGTGVGTGSTWNTTATDEVRLIPFVVPTAPTAAMQFAFRISSTPGSTMYWAIYASDANGLPTGSPVSTHTVASPNSFTTYTFTSGSAGTYSKGDLIWIAYFGQTTISTMNQITGAGMCNLVPYSSGSAFSPNQNAKWRNVIQATFSTAGVWETLSASTIYDDSIQLTAIPQLGLSFE